MVHIPNSLNTLQSVDSAIISRCRGAMTMTPLIVSPHVLEEFPLLFLPTLIAPFFLGNIELQ